MTESQKASKDSLSLFESVTSANPKTSPNPPSDLLEYRNMDLKKRFSIDSVKFFNQEHIKEYLDNKYLVESHNRSSFIWLWEVYQEEKDVSRKRALEVKMTQFKKSIQNTQRPYKSLGIDFSKFKFNDPNKVDVDWNG